MEIPTGGIKKIIEKLYKIRFLLVGLIFIISFILPLFIKIKLENSIKMWFLPDNKHYIDYKNFSEEFQEGVHLIILISARDIFSKEILIFIKELSEKLKRLKHVKYVYSLATASRIISEKGQIKIEPLLKQEFLPQEVKTYAYSEELIKDYLISSKGKYSCIVMSLEELSSEEMRKTVKEIKEITSKIKPTDVDVYWSGEMMILYEFDKFSEENLKRFPMCIIFLMFLTTFLFFRNFYKSFLIMIGSLLSVQWALSFHILVFKTLNVVTTMIIPVVLILSISNSIHIIKYYQIISTQISEKKEQFIYTLEYIIRPCFISSLTTAIGLFSIRLSGISALKEFATSAAVGILFAFFITITIIPTFLTFVRNKKNKYYGENLKFLELFSSFCVKYAKLIIILFCFSLIIFIIGIKRLKVETDRLRWLPENNPVYKASLIIDKYLSGIKTIELVLEGKENIFKDPFVLERVDFLTNQIRKLKPVNKTLALPSFIKRLNKVLHDDKEDFYKIPQSQKLISQELLLFSLYDEGKREIEKFVSCDYSMTRIAIRCENISSEQLHKLADKITKLAKSILPGQIKITTTGSCYLFSTLDKELVRTQIISFFSAFLIIIGCLFFVFKNFVYRFVIVVANLFPVLAVLGLMGYLNFPLNMATVMIAAICFGIAVDDTVYFLTKNEYLWKISKKFDIKKTILEAIIPMFLTTFINIVGFCVLLFSKFAPTRQFGLLVAFTLFFAFIVDALLAPALLTVLKRRKIT